MRRTPSLAALALPAAVTFGLGLALAGGPPRKPDEGKAPPPPAASKPGTPAPSAPPSAPAPPPARRESAHADLKGQDGKSMGGATLEQTPNGVLINATLSGLSPGMHAFHIHETGKCEPPFKSAGGHFNPEGHKHGLKNPAGLHAGDLPNVDVGADGKARFQFFAHGVTLETGKKNSLLDADGSSLVVHKEADDLATDPAGAAGDRIVCGVIEKDPGSP